MANTAITPTRMVLNQLKGRLKTARRGHKLLKDKRDELMRQFLDNVRLNKQLRAKVEQGLTEAFGSLSVASAIMSPEMLEQSLLYPRQSVELGMTYQNIMSVNVPVYDFQTRNSDPSEIFPYGFAQTSGELDDALEKLAGLEIVARHVHAQTGPRPPCRSRRGRPSGLCSQADFQGLQHSIRHLRQGGASLHGKGSVPPRFLRRSRFFLSFRCAPEGYPR